jgi:hypothetical protein
VNHLNIVLDSQSTSHIAFSPSLSLIVINDIDNVILKTDGPNVTALGSVAFSFYWRHSLENILPPQSTGLIIVFENPCGNQHFTYQIDGQHPHFLGFGDLHDATNRFASLAQSSSLADLTNRDGSYTGLPMNRDFCPFTLTVYPSADMETST